MKDLRGGTWLPALLMAAAGALSLWPAHSQTRAASAPTGAAPSAALPTTGESTAKGPFATVGDTVITGAEYQRALAVAMRKKYYHAKPPENEYPKFQREVGDEVVNRVLLLAEARRRGIQPDQEQIKATVAGYDVQYKNNPNWKTNRDKMLSAVVPQLENESLLNRLEKVVKNVPLPAEAVARGYYEQHKDLFVEPEQVKLSVILLKVDPSSRQDVWDSAMAEGRSIHKRLVGGADFGELARLHSGDKSADRGGQMEYTHRGMLPEAVHTVVDKLQPGQLSEPVQLLEGVAILRLDDRKQAKQRAFDQVKERAAGLWQRDEADQRWKKLIADLRKKTTIRIDESHYAPLRATGDQPRSS